PFSEKQMDVLAEVLAHVSDEWQARCAALETRLVLLESRTAPAELEARIAELERRPTPKYCGLWQAGEQYAEGNPVTFEGAMGIALRGTRRVPPGPDWQLCVRRGRDARSHRGRPA